MIWGVMALVLLGLAGTLLVVISTVSGAAGTAEPFKILDQYRPRAATAVIKAVSLSASDQQRFNPQAVGTEFPGSTTHVVVWYRWEGALPGYRLEVHWFHEGTKVLEQGEQVTKHAGAEAWVLKATAGPLPAGRYRVDLLENGTMVTSVPFRVGGTAGGIVMLEQFRPRAAAGAAIQSVSLGASDTDEFDATRVGTEFPVGIRRVVVYYLWADAPAGLKISARWLTGSSVVGQTEQVISTPTGFGVFSVGPLPAGSYQVELLENGTPVTAVPFRVGTSSR
jgi:hypothetical protein